MANISAVNLGQPPEALANRNQAGLQAGGQPGLAQGINPHDSQNVGNFFQNAAAKVAGCCGDG